MTTNILPHNQRPASVWSSGGSAYDEISRQIASALEHCVRRARPRDREKFLDVATGTGWTSRLLASRGVDVIGVDIADDLLAAARGLADRDRYSIRYQVGDAEQLPFADGQFDGVVSTFGVMFASRPEVAARELARVCRRGGRVALATWAPEGNVFGMFQVMRQYMPPPPAPAPPSPFAWGDRARVTELLGDAFDLAFEDGVTNYFEEDGETAWQRFVTGYGPTKMLAANLPDDQRERLHRDFVAFHDRFATPLGVTVPRQYLITVGTRR